MADPVSTPADLAAVVREQLPTTGLQRHKDARAALDALLALVEAQAEERTAVGTRLREAERQLEEMRRERDEWESRYEELLSAVGGVWPT